MLKANSVSMLQYVPAKSSTSEQDDVPLFFASYIAPNAKDTALNDLWLLYCFDVFCTKSNRITYSVRTAGNIDYPQLSLAKILPSDSSGSSQTRYSPKVFWFENGTSLMALSCNDTSSPWNCTKSSRYTQTQQILVDENYEGTSMQISVSQNPENHETAWEDSSKFVVLFSQVMSTESGAGIFNGSTYINSYSYDGSSYHDMLLATSSGSDQFSIAFDVTIFVAISWSSLLLTICGILVIYKLVTPAPFISKMVRNAYLLRVALDSSRIRPLSYWFFFANLICSAMCCIPWFTYFDYDYIITTSMILPPVVPVLLTLGFVLFLHFSSLQPQIAPILLVISFLYWLSTIFLSYSFAFVWNLKAENCETSDLSGLKVVILVGHLATFCVIEYLLLWSIRCYQALKLASPENVRENALMNPHGQGRRHHNDYHERLINDT